MKLLLGFLPQDVLGANVSHYMPMQTPSWALQAVVVCRALSTSAQYTEGCTHCSVLSGEVLTLPCLASMNCCTTKLRLAVARRLH